MRHLNLVFQGGGMRGIAHVGAYSKVPENVRLHAVGGSSAGAIVAGLIAIGRTKGALKEILSDPELLSLLSRDDLERTERIRACLSQLAPITSNLSKRSIGLRDLWKYRKPLRQLSEEGQFIWAKMGVYDSSRLSSFLTRAFEQRKFRDVKVDNLRILAADISNGEYKIYDKYRSAEMYIADAVLASANIPLFFRPYRSGPRFLVDGGMLSNFPSFLFAQGKYKTVGFRLRDVPIPTAIHSPSDYLLRLLLTMTEAHDKQRGYPPHFNAFDIFVPPEIHSTKFNLSAREVNALFDAGLKVGEHIDWNQVSSAAAVVNYYDPLPDDTLRFSLEQANKLWESYSDSSTHVDELAQEHRFIAKVEEDWTVSYERFGSLEVRGLKNLAFTRSTIEVSPGRQLSKSISEVAEESAFEETDEQGSPLSPLIRIPAINDERRKAFLLFYTPPISPGMGKRWFRTRFTVSKDFEETLGKGLTDVVTYSAKQIAVAHRLSLQLEIWLHTSLPDLLLKSTSGPAVTFLRLQQGSSANEVYRVYGLRFETEVRGRIDIEVSLCAKTS